MSLAQNIENDFKKAMLERNKDLANLLRLLKAALKNEMINLRKQELSDQEVIKVLKYEAKKHQDSIQQFAQGGRQDLVNQEKRELAMIKKYLPPEMSQEEIKKIVQEVVSGLGEVAPSQFGQVMGAVMKKVGGQTDGAIVSKVVKETLNK
jgi:uncharacterized protein YqeY